MVDVRRLKMLQMVQLFKCEEDALQVRLLATTTKQKYTYTALPVMCVCVCAGCRVAR